MLFFSLPIIYALTWPDLKKVLSSRIRNFKTHINRRTRISRWLGLEIVVVGLPPLVWIGLTFFILSRRNLYYCLERKERSGGKKEVTALYLTVSQKIHFSVKVHQSFYHNHLNSVKIKLNDNFWLILNKIFAKSDFFLMNFQIIFYHWVFLTSEIFRVSFSLSQELYSMDELEGFVILLKD